MYIGKPFWRKLAQSGHPDFVRLSPFICKGQMTTSVKLEQMILGANHGCCFFAEVQIIERQNVELPNLCRLQNVFM
jgi:hypothetical protein